ncbi:LuxQ periplasmic sensor domain-containing protein [Vibrio tapetis subsp. quintayensis]|uniref:LuxQ periplasmic sensor domain-containing protein n=1 Tax=Vibrio tapetis TaxID=52443 RepID=UPI0025B34C4D|nr:LuxQ periplasmic sensor domain-containing protein [Vibrio tapetis]MDN3678787.1 LuxQ periplasmic sensor domain-containing protein [Vibrio tapetis subsp. quintayensis]
MHFKKKHKLATLLIRFIILIFGILMMGVVLFSYQWSSKIIQQEVERTSSQASSLIQHLFDYKLMTMQSHQDSNAMSLTLQNLLENGAERELDFFFLDVEQSDPVNSPDFRFVTELNGDIRWSDGNSYFYGLTDDSLIEFAKSTNTNSFWFFKHESSIMGMRDILLRRSPIISTKNGQLLGYLHVAMVLNNNFSLIEQMKEASNSDGIILLSGNNAVASSIYEDDPLYEWVLQAKDGNVDVHFKNYLFNITDIKIHEVTTPLSVAIVQNNSTVQSLEESYKVGLSISLVIMLCLALVIRQIIQRIINTELSSLMEYARSASDHHHDLKFQGSSIYEFEHVGTALEGAFSAIKEKDKSFQDLFNFSLSPIIVWGIDGQIMKMNPAAHKALMLEESDGALEAFQRKVSLYLTLVMNGETAMGVNIPIENKIFRWNLSSIEMDSGIDSIIGQGQDITALIEAEKQSNLARLEAESSANARADFLAKMSHEIRTPLNAILGVSQLLKHSLTHTKNKEQVDLLYRSGEHLLTVLNDVLDFSKIEQGKLHIETSDFVFSRFVQPLVNIHQQLCINKQLEFSVINDIPLNTVICADQVRLNQVILNLLSNAIKFTSLGSIKLHFYFAEPNTDKVTRNNVQSLCVVVQDTGIGLTGESIQSMFEPFTQAERTTTREFGGSGLGLAIVKNLLDMMGGDIQVESALGQGSEFTMTIPVTVSKNAMLDAVKEETKHNYDLFVQSQRVLLVEDNKSNAYIAQAFCSKYNMETDWVEDGVAAIEKLKTVSYDLILMDNQMPNMDGVEATRIIRRELGIATPIFACTADAFESTKQAFMDAGANYIIVKPIKEQPLFEALSFYKSKFLPK